MWLMTMFDLPSTSRTARGAYVRFRKFLLRNGFEMRQKSIYLRWEETLAAAQTTMRKVLAQAPTDGRVSVLPLTPRALAQMGIQVDGEREAAPAMPDEFLIC